MARSAPAIFLIVTTALAYSNSLNGIFVFDDSQRILENPAVRLPGMTWDRIGGLFLFARPLSDLTLRLNFQLGGPEPSGYHIFNIAVHVLAALALMGFARICFGLAGSNPSRSRVSAFALALIWATHPLQTQAVTYIYQRAESTAGLFFLLTLYCAASGLSATPGDPGRRRWLAASVAACAVGHLCKQTLFTAPLAVLAFDYCFVAGALRESVRRSWCYYLALSLTWLIGAGLILATTMDDSVGYSIRTVTWHGYALSQPAVILHYLRLSVWPDALVLNYNWPVAKALPTILPPLLAVLALIASTFYALSRPEKRWRALGFAGVWFFITLALSSSLFPIKDLAFEHRMYLALASVAAVLVATLEWALPSSRTRLVLAFLIASGLGIRTYLRNEDYRSPFKIWGGVLARVPGDPRALNELGNAYRDDGRFGEALTLYGKAIEADPENPGPHLNVGLIQQRLGNLQTAEWHFREAILKRPVYPEAHLGLGNALVTQGRQEEALQHYALALAQRPGFFEALAARANTLSILGRFEEALEFYEQALSSRPDRFEIYSDVGTALFRMGRYEESLRFYYEALARQPDSAPVHLSTANTLRKLGHHEEAGRHEARAKELMPLAAPRGSNHLVTPGFGPR